MTTTEKLKRIKEICTANLEIAAKRTPGEYVTYSDGEIYGTDTDGSGIRIATVDIYDDQHYIATCAGAAEAGWKATIAAIDGLLDLAENDPSWLDRDPMSMSIISAWEG